eukprot:NODE_2267_length_965_cov_295.404396.p3 GENE.NODE_2267_length_965_cov_295.404396~~NODE_2267_length_965_cov_295.404396.p3  ORF type:complete len:228 (+),score=54.01 NODE_2267_length_965_cov_295.404396:151-834(+)
MSLRLAGASGQRRRWRRSTTRAAPCFYYSYFSEMHKAIYEDSVNLMGFFAWSLMDNFEWERGYSERFGVLFNDFRFGADPDAPNSSTPVYDPRQPGVVRVCGSQCNISGIPEAGLHARSQQTRHAKNTFLWLQWVWKVNSLVDPARFLAGSIGGDVCYGNSTESSETHCALPSDFGEPPEEAYRCALDNENCGGEGLLTAPCCNASSACRFVSEDVGVCAPAASVVV